MLIGARTSGGIVDIRLTTGGANYPSVVSVTFSGGGGSGAAAVAVMAGTRVESVIVTNPGYGYTESPSVSFSATTGSGAAASAYAYTGQMRPMSFIKGRLGTVYGVDGMGRGIRWEGGSAQPIGLHKPAAPVVVASTTTPGQRVSAIQLIDGGRGYSSAPSVIFSGGTPTEPAEAQAAVGNGRVLGVRISKAGLGYQAAPTVAFSGGIGSGAEIVLTASGGIGGIEIPAGGSGYTSSGANAPVVTVATSNGLTGFNAVLTVAEGAVVDAQVLSAGTGATASPVLSVTAGVGSGASLTPVMSYSVAAATVGATGGGGYLTPPVITVRRHQDDPSGAGGEVECTVGSDGAIDNVSVVSGGAYLLPPSAVILDTTAKAQASMAEPLRGTYLCGVRYIDATSATQSGPLASSISHLVEVSTGSGMGGLEWSFTHPHTDERVAAMELWRTSGDQKLLLFRVATIKKTDPEWGGTYQDNMGDNVLTDAAREGYGLMPITLPNGQVNARRFEVPPGRFAIATMFQDRAWYAFDTSGERPNSLYFSEVDEPESVPPQNELVVQENTDMPDSVVALIPLGPMLLVAQTSHMYRLMYVAQPVIDASIQLVARRGVLNNRCWAVLAGAAFMADSLGVYAFDGSREESVSVAVDNYWRDGIIDLSKAEKFHVDADHLTRTVRFYYCRQGDDEPSRALCYCTATKAWWEEEYASPVTASAGTLLGGQLRRALGCGDGAWRKESGTKDGEAGVAYAIKTGNLAILDDPDRAISVVYKPTAGDSQLDVSLFFNNSDTARANAIQADRGAGFSAIAGGPVSLNMKKLRSALGEATGAATAHYAGRKSERSAGGDQHIAVQFAGTQSDDPVTIYGMRMGGVT